MFNSLKFYLVLSLIAVSGCNDINTLETSPAETVPALKPNLSTQQPVKTRYNIGSHASEQLIAGWDIDIQIDGTGLPKGSGSVPEGEMLYDNLCAACHGTFGEGEQQWPKLAGGEKSLTDQRPLKTIGSYWPYSTTLWDYINRAMPFPAPQSLEINEVYAITAYVLYLNEIVDSDFVLSETNLASIEMPNQAGFYPDNRPDTNNQRCMKNCKTSAELKIIPGPVYQDENQALEQAVTEKQTKSNSGELIYLSGCNLCHDNGLMQAPRISITDDWQSRLQLGMDSIYNNAINGKGKMPAKGGKQELSDNSIKQAVDYMLNTLE